MSTARYRCPCGKGQYTVTYLSDDWNRSDEHGTMLCPECAEIYCWYSYQLNHKGIYETYYKWISKEHLQKRNQLGEELMQRHGQLESYLNQNYSKQWLQKFDSMTKKAIWKQLRDGQSLSTFYNHVRMSSLQHVLLGYLDYRGVETIIRVLGLDDEQLGRQVAQIHRLQELKGEHEQQMLKAGTEPSPSTRL